MKTDNTDAVLQGVTAAFAEDVAYPDDNSRDDNFLYYINDRYQSDDPNFVIMYISAALGCIAATRLLVSKAAELFNIDPKEPIDEIIRSLRFTENDYLSHIDLNAEKFIGDISVIKNEEGIFGSYPVSTFLSGLVSKLLLLGFNNGGIVTYNEQEIKSSVGLALLLRSVFGNQLDKSFYIPLDNKLRELVNIPITSSNVMLNKVVSDNSSINVENYLSYINGFRISINIDEAAEYAKRWLSENDEGTIKECQTIDTRHNYLLSMPIIIKADIEIPRKAANWMCQSKDIKNEDLYNIQQYLIKSYRQNWLLSTAPDDIVSPITSLDHVIDKIKHIRTVKGTNSDNLITLFDGTPMWVPDMTDLNTYIDYKNGLLDTIKINEHNECIVHVIKSNINKYLYTDWRLDKAIYVNNNGNINTIDLSGSKKCTAASLVKLAGINLSKKSGVGIQTILNMLDKWLSDNNKSLLEYTEAEDWLPLIPINKHKTWLDTANKNLNTAFYSSGIIRLLSIPPKETSCIKFLAIIQARLAECMNYDKTTYDFDKYEGIYTSARLGELGTIAGWSGTPILRAIVVAASEMYEQYKDAPLELYSYCKVALRSFLFSLPYLIVMSKVKNSMKDLHSLDKQERSQYQLTLDNNYKIRPVPNIKDDMTFLHHQVLVDAQLDKDPDSLIIHVEPGGGKTLSAVIAICRELAKGKRIIVVSPNYLIPNYIEDTMFATQGRINVFPINNEIYKTYGEEALRKKIMNAPINTYFIVGLNIFSKGSDIKFSYMGESININQVVEFLRDISWDIIFDDESHLLGNPDTSRTRNVARLASSVLKIREMTGTFINGTMLDAIGQTRILNPAIFGHVDDFTDAYGAQFKGSKVVKWKQGAEIKIRDAIRQHSGYIYVPRKEWAHILPFNEENFHYCSLSPQQANVYRTILTQVVEEIKRDPKLRKALEDESLTDAQLMAMLQQHLPRIEQFLGAPDYDDASDILRGEDLVSPKIKVINNILKEHFSNPETKDSQVLIFVSYHHSAGSIYDNLAPEFKKYALHYKATEKNELIPRMKNDPNVKVIVGVENSLNTGHNFQKAARLIRYESIWSPGTLYQADSRIFRPNLKQKETRKSIYLDWIVVDKTLDITKAARLISKLVSKAKFDNPEDSRYTSVPNLPLVSMNIESLLHNNDFQSNLLPYIEAYDTFKEIEKEDFNIYREKHKKTKMLPVPVDEVMKGSSWYQVPYVPGMILPFQDDMGLENLTDTALRLNKSIYDINQHITGKLVHTEHGDGKVIKASRLGVTVKLESGNKVSVNKTCCFIKQYPDIDVIDNIIKNVGLPLYGKTKKVKKERIVVESENESVDIYGFTLNGMIGVGLSIKNPDTDAQIAKRWDFKYVPEYLYCYINENKLDKVIKALNSEFKLTDQSLNRMKEVSKVDNVDIKNFYTVARRKMPKDVLNVYPVIEDNELYLIADAINQPAAKKLKDIKIKGIHWYEEEASYIRFFVTVKEAKKFIKKFKNESGFNIENIEDLRDTFKTLEG